MSDIRIQAQQSAGGVTRASAGAYRLAAGTRDGALFTTDWVMALAMEGRVYVASDADQNDVVTGQTSFVNTTPTFALDVPSGTTAIPLFLNLTQAGTVASDYVDVLIEIDNIAGRASGGTAETVLASRTDDPTAENCTFYSNPTATAGYGVLVAHYRLAEDVDPASADAGGPFAIRWRPEVPLLLVGAASLKVFTFCGSGGTGPSWLWSFGWAEVGSTSIT